MSSCWTKPVDYLSYKVWKTLDANLLSYGIHKVELFHLRVCACYKKELFCVAVITLFPLVLSVYLCCFELKFMFMKKVS